MQNQGIFKIVKIEKLDNTFDRYDLEVEDNHNFFANGILVHNCSVGMVYRNGKLVEAYTRGDGYEGQNILETVKRFGNHFPKTIPYNGELLVRGEIVVPKNDIQHMINEMVEECCKKYANGRNGVAGALNSKIAPEAFVKYAHIVCYHLEGEYESEHDMFEELKSQGFETAKWDLINGNEINSDMMTKNNIELKESYDYEIDGTIITQDVLTEDVKGFETGTLNPKRSRKFKVGANADSVETTITGIIWQLSSYGYFKPVIQIEPVELDGATITFATGNNYKNVIDNHMCVGATVSLKRAGGVIPFIEKTMTYPTVEEYNLPDCKTALTENGVDLLYDDEDTDYESQIALQKDVYFCSSLGVEYAGEGNITKLMQHTRNAHLNPQNLIFLPVDCYEEAIGTNGVKMYNSLHKRLKEVTIAEFMDAVSAFGRGIGSKRLQSIIDVYGELPYDRNKILSLDGWSDILTEQYVNHYIQFVNWMNILRDGAIELKTGVVEMTGDDLAGTVVVFTGVRDKDMEQRIIQRGGKVASSFTKAVNLVIADNVDSGSSKIQKAKEKGIKVMSYSDALQTF
jgi:DNA ligase (NAD+)